MNKLEQLKTMTTVVADTGNIESIRRFQPTDATTNPTLLLQAAQLESYQEILKKSVQHAIKENLPGESFLQSATDYFTVQVGKEISQIIPGRVSTEVDARLSFDTQATVEKAKRFIELYNNHGVSSDRILIKIASTWEGIQAAAELERNGINCNLTLLFSFSQAVACAEAGVTLISPFVGRIYDWYQKKSPNIKILPKEDPGVKSVQEIYRYYKENSYPTIVMGASFRTTGQIEELAGCDYLTISPDLLEALENDNAPLTRQLFPNIELTPENSTPKLNENLFRWQMNEDAMATDKLAEGIRNFAVNQQQLENIIKQLASQK
ncbi:transaldolase [Porticoccus sp. W117]|uniref:transaldolase n=1 Tax=Porticoccus sp. W117 TaxID=3054777 RepID=UPI00259304C5|nr:transaldolase [Porticoccus sp. W117]MDM3872347.1 transaldolase [Porticoccus sp. W117]